ncbi:uncharacterized protein LOC120107518 [Phoenix dactylifera]|uniref:Uncharacterized protein LOC120107518 n=1 Tax=Phoenix dactylifera TaxID=42345 RepID=A0A8B8ZYV8_PHODC|nr:uncharacterized protein LOC120107518 [Phoenix dactylifera]
MTPAFPDCRSCGQPNCMRPVVAAKKQSINWLFMLLGQTLGCCTLDQLKYFCKHTKNHRTGAKDRVLYLTYLALCKQLDPAGPFERTPSLPLLPRRHLFFSPTSSPSPPPPRALPPPPPPQPPTPLPFPPATVHSLNHLLSQNITNITGEAQCKRCEASQVISYDLVSKFNEVAAFIRARKHWMHDRAPAEWMTPAFPDCRSCGQPNCMRPVVAAKKQSINWLFMLLGQTLGCCTLDQLKYFCKHTKNHRTGAKDRVLYLTYLALCKQLDPAGPF